MRYVPLELAAPSLISPLGGTGPDSLELPAPLRPLPPSAEIPRRIASYRLHALLGAGGMATVYLAEREALLGRRRWCALKVPNLGVSGSAYERMFMAEARLAAEIHHPHVCGVFDYGSAEGRAYMAMEYADGRSLLDVFRALGERPRSKREACLIVKMLADVCEGLSAIHDQSSVVDGKLGLVHRDISPDNLVLCSAGFAKIIDLGLVKTETRGDKTEPGFVKGKISYVAPELLGGETATPRADVWSLGVVAWELLTGQRLFHEATDIATLRKVIDHEILAPSKVQRGLPEELNAVVLRALERDPKNRFASAAEFAAQLLSFLADQRQLVQHSHLAVWLEQLFPGERERVERALYALSQAPSPPAPRPAPSKAPRSLPRMANMLRRIRSHSSATLRAVPVHRRTLASVGVAFVLLLGVVSQLGWSRPSSALVLSSAETPKHVPRPSNAISRSIEPRFLPPGLVVDVERAPGSSELVLRIRAPEPATSLQTKSESQRSPKN